MDFVCLLPFQINQSIRRVVPMDDYQEELLEFHAAERDPAEPAEDATEM